LKRKPIEDFTQQTAPGASHEGDLKYFLESYDTQTDNGLKLDFRYHIYYRLLTLPKFTLPYRLSILSCAVANISIVYWYGIFSVSWLTWILIAVYLTYLETNPLAVFIDNIIAGIGLSITCYFLPIPASGWLLATPFIMLFLSYLVTDLVCESCQNNEAMALLNTLNCGNETCGFKESKDRAVYLYFKYQANKRFKALDDTQLNQIYTKYLQEFTNFKNEKNPSKATTSQLGKSQYFVLVAQSGIHTSMLTGYDQQVSAAFGYATEYQGPEFKEEIFKIFTIDTFELVLQYKGFALPEAKYNQLLEFVADLNPLMPMIDKNGKWTTFKDKYNKNARNEKTYNQIFPNVIAPFFQNNCRHTTINILKEAIDLDDSDLSNFGLIKPSKQTITINQDGKLNRLPILMPEQTHLLAPTIKYQRGFKIMLTTILSSALVALSYWYLGISLISLTAALAIAEVCIAGVMSWLLDTILPHHLMIAVPVGSALTAFGVWWLIPYLPVLLSVWQVILPSATLTISAFITHQCYQHFTYSMSDEQKEWHQLHRLYDALPSNQLNNQDNQANQALMDFKKQKHTYQSLCKKTA
jgi:hypothetical protein